MKRQPSKQAIIEAIENAIQAEAGSLAESTTLRGLSGWDSLGIVAFIDEVLQSFRIELPVDDILECGTVHELVEMVLRR